MKGIRERQEKERKRREEWSKRLKSNYISSSTIGNGTLNNSSWITGPNVSSSGSITTTSIGDSKVTIDGGEHGSMRVDVPLLVNGRDVMKELDELRDAVLLLKRDVNMEAKYPKLKKLKDEYEKALEMYKTFETIKDSK